MTKFIVDQEKDWPQVICGGGEQICGWMKSFVVDCEKFVVDFKFFLGWVKRFEVDSKIFVFSLLVDPEMLVVKGCGCG